MALSTVTFMIIRLQKELIYTKNDLKKFAGIRVAVNNIYVDNVSFAQYEKQLQKLLDQHVITEEIIRLTEQIDILDTETFNEELEKVVGNRAKSRENSFGNLKVYQRKKEIPTLFCSKTIRTHQSKPLQICELIDFRI